MFLQTFTYNILYINWESNICQVLVTVQYISDLQIPHRDALPLSYIHSMASKALYK